MTAPNPGHTGDNICVNISGVEKTLQESINATLFKGSPKTSASCTSPNPGHNSDEIWVSINGSEMTLKDAVLNTDMCGLGSTINSYSNLKNPSHPATQINVLAGSEMTLQQAIDSGILAKIDGGWSTWSSWGACSKSCGGGNQIRTRTCTNPTSFCGGTNCPGSNTENKNCNTQACCTPTTTYYKICDKWIGGHACIRNNLCISGTCVFSAPTGGSGGTYIGYGRIEKSCPDCNYKVDFYQKNVCI